MIKIFENEKKYDGIEEFESKKIETESFNRIRAELLSRRISFESKEEEAVVVRAVHSTADFDFAKNIRFSLNAFSKAFSVFESGKCVIVTDTNMALQGVSSFLCEKIGIKKTCFMADFDVSECSKKNNLTRAAVSVDKAAQTFEGKNVIYAVGNAPTALVRLRLLFDAGIFEPSLVIAVPVGFVNVVRAKELIMESKMDFIAAIGQKGGSGVSAAILNALFHLFLEKNEKS